MYAQFQWHLSDTNPALRSVRRHSLKWVCGIVPCICVLQTQIFLLADIVVYHQM